MKRVFLYMLFAVLGMGYAMAQAEIKFDKTTADVGTFSEESPVVSCVFTFTNIGDAPLVIHQAIAAGRDLHIGEGHGPVDHFFRFRDR